MTTEPTELRAQSHDEIGAAIQQNVGILVERWARRARAEQPTAKRVHHDVLLDHLPTFLWELGQSLAEPGDEDPLRHCRLAGVHGDQRWETGWSIAEVIRDYQILRLILVEYLEEALDRQLCSREVMALGLAVDDAIAASVSAYLACANRADADGPTAPGISAEGLLGVLGILGHELRNPLAPLGNALQVVRVAGHDPARVEQAALLMERQLRVLARLVEDLMDVPRLVRGKMSLQQERLDLARLVRDCAEDRRPALAEAGITLSLDVPGPPVWTTGDATRLTQAVGNLIANAQKFTDGGGRVTVRLTADAGRRTARLVVRDTGIGIDGASLPKVFETYMQADRSVWRSRGGLGIGLALVKGIVELHGGTIRAASDGPGTGAEFTVEVPLLDFTAPASTPDAPRSTRGAGPRRVLVIEDNRDSAESLKMYLELFGHEVSVAHSGPAGLAAAAHTSPDVIVCDLSLPGMSGYEVCGSLRKDPAFASTLIVALSGISAEIDDGKCVQAGFDCHLVKPVEPERLARLIAGHGFGPRTL